MKTVSSADPTSTLAITTPIPTKMTNTGANKKGRHLIPEDMRLLSSDCWYLVIILFQYIK